MKRSVTIVECVYEKRTPFLPAGWGGKIVVVDRSGETYRINFNRPDGEKTWYANGIRCGSRLLYGPREHHALSGWVLRAVKDHIRSIGGDPS